MNFLESLTAPLPQITAIEIVFNILLACVLGLLVTGVYYLTTRHQAVNRSLMMTMVILAMVVALVMMVIGNSIARAFSLVGALSIIRFRTVVKDNRDIAFVFLSLGAGMAAGIGNYTIALYGVGSILILLLALDFAQFGILQRGMYLLRIQAVPVDLDAVHIQQTIENLTSHHRRLAIKTVRMGQFVEQSYLVRLKKGVSESDVIAALSGIEGMERVILLLQVEEVDA